MLLPPIDRRREMDKNLVAFFRDHRLIAFRRAIADFCRYYHLRRPQIGWYEYIDWGKTAGKTFEDGRIHLVHPENWKRGRVYNSERMWVQMVYHELAHYLFWTDAESKAETFTHRMVRGLRRAPKRARVAIARGSIARGAKGVRASSAVTGGTAGISDNRRRARASSSQTSPARASGTAATASPARTTAARTSATTARTSSTSTAVIDKGARRARTSAASTSGQTSAAASSARRPRSASARTSRTATPARPSRRRSTVRARTVGSGNTPVRGDASTTIVRRAARTVRAGGTAARGRRRKLVARPRPSGTRRARA
jgi:hypothetical protein